MNNEFLCSPQSDGAGDGYIVDRFPDAGVAVEVLCSLGGRSRVAPFLCSWTGDDWVVAGTDKRFRFKVIGWRRTEYRLRKP